MRCATEEAKEATRSRRTRTTAGSARLRCATRSGAGPTAWPARDEPTEVTRLTRRARLATRSARSTRTAGLAARLAGTEEPGESSRSATHGRLRAATEEVDAVVRPLRERGLARLTARRRLTRLARSARLTTRLAGLTARLAATEEERASVADG